MLENDGEFYDFKITFTLFSKSGEFEKTVSAKNSKEAIEYLEMYFENDLLDITRIKNIGESNEEN